MGRQKEIVVDGISAVSKNEFQSYITCISKSKSKVAIKKLVIPKEIEKKLQLSQDSLVEVAIRKVTSLYAKVNYKLEYVPHWVICPQCNQKGKITRSGATGYFVVRHYTKGKGQGTMCHLTKNEANKLNNEFWNKMSQF